MSPSRRPCPVEAISSATALTCPFVAVSVSVDRSASWSSRASTSAVSVRRRHDPVHEPGRRRLGRRERPARQHQLLRQRRADLAHQARDPRPCQRDAQLDLGDREHGVVGGDAQVAGGGEHDPAADAAAVHTDDGHGAHVGDRLGHDPAEVADLAHRHVRVGVGEVVEVEAGAERPPGAGHPDDLHAAWVSNHRAASASSTRCCRDKALRRSGRCSSRRPIGPSTVTRRHWKLGWHHRQRIHPSAATPGVRGPHTRMAANTRMGST